VKQNWFALQYVPEALKTPNLCKIALEQAFDEVRMDYRVLKDIPITLISAQVCKFAVEQNKGALCYVPEDLKTPELCKIAVKQDGDTLRHVPEDLKTPELCEIAVERDGGALLYVPNQKEFLKFYPKFLPYYFRITYNEHQDPDLISLLILTVNNKDIDEVGDRINLDLIQEKDLLFLVGCKNPTITEFLNKKFSVISALLFSDNL
jgi:hypothetical protein